MIMRFLKTNPGLKLISVVISLIIWLVVINVSKPEVTREQTVNLEVENEAAFESQSKSWQIDRTAVKVSYTVRTDQQFNISTKDFRAYIDLKDYSITGSVPVYVEVLNDKDSLIQNVTPKPSVVHVSIEDMQEKKFTVNVHQVGETADGYKVGSVIVPTDTVYADGPESEIGRISSIGIQVDVNGLSEDKSGSAKLCYYDANGNEIKDISDVTLSAEEASYTVVMYKQKTIELTASAKGTPAEGYSYNRVLITPATVKVAGRPALIDSLTKLSLPTVDISNVTESVTELMKVEDYLPDGVELAEPSIEVTITAEITKLPETTTIESSTAAGPAGEMSTSSAETAASESVGHTAESESSHAQTPAESTKKNSSESASEATSESETVKQSISETETAEASRE